MKTGKSKVSSADQALIDQLGSIHEDTFTDMFLRPLFCAMGYDRVEFYGGSLERGKDLIASRKIPPKSEDYSIFIQSKRTKGLSGTKGAQRFSTLLHQLRQCATQGLDRGDGVKIRPNEIYLASPDIVPQRLRDELAGQLAGISPAISICDGVEIIRWIRQYAPELLRSLNSLQDKLTSIETIDEKNAELINALSSQRAPDLTQLYRDLSFFVGSVDSNTLLHLDIRIDNKPVHIEPAKWASARQNISHIVEQYKIDFINGTLDEIESAFEDKLSLFESTENRANIKLAAEIRAKADDGMTRIESSLRDIESKELIRIESKAKAGKIESKSDELLAEVAAVREILKSNPNKFTKEKSTQNGIKNSSLLAITSEIYSIFEMQHQIRRIEQRIVSPPKYLATLNGRQISDYIEKKKNSYFRLAKKICDDDVTPDMIRNFLSETEETLGFLSIIKSKEFDFNKSFIFERKKITEDRVSISPHEVFDSRKNIAVYGGAGVGKTTTLKAYVFKALKSGRKDIIYVPLNKIVEGIFPILAEIGRQSSGEVQNKNTNTEKREQEKERAEKEKQFAVTLLAKIVLLSKGLDLSPNFVREAEKFLKSGVTLVLDGLDEIFDTLKEILPAISTFAGNNTNCQLIVSSRDCVSYLSNIQFLGITLLPFTKEQLIYFVNGWVTSDQKRISIIESIENGGLYDVIKTPLLATIACSLAEKGIKVVSNERDIYYERIRLLTGAYDESKGIKRQKQSSDLLMLVARKIAFEMHKSRCRSMQWEGILESARSCLSRKMDDELIEKAILELIDPCNVLVRDQSTNEIGFGHFRFQEHLVSEEFASNRDIQVGLYSGSDWWRGAICLYARQVDAEYLFKEVYEIQGRIGQSIQTFTAIISESAPEDRARLSDALSLYMKSDSFDNSVLDDPNLYLDTFDRDDLISELGLDLDRDNE